MKKKIIFLLTAFVATCHLACFSQSSGITGAWETREGDQSTVVIFQDGYFTCTQYTQKAFTQSWGGPYLISDNQLSITIEFNSADTAKTGTSEEFYFSVKNNFLELKYNTTAKSIKYSRVDDGSGALAGVWKITAREQDGKLIPIHQTGARKTLKILTGTRFQWFAINPDTKQFSGAGGGTYTFLNGKYTENILFFSRDNSRVGAQLVFDGKIENGQWHHSGLSSKGDKIYEVWGRVSQGPKQ